MSDLVELAKSKGQVVRICDNTEFAHIRAHKVPEGGENERMRLTANGALLVQEGGYYWSVSGTEELREYLEGL